MCDHMKGELWPVDQEGYNATIPGYYTGCQTFGICLNLIWERMQEDVCLNFHHDVTPSVTSFLYPLCPTLTPYCLAICPYNQAVLSTDAGHGAAIVFSWHCFSRWPNSVQSIVFHLCHHLQGMLDKKQMELSNIFFYSLVSWESIIFWLNSI